MVYRRLWDSSGRISSSRRVVPPGHILLAVILAASSVLADEQPHVPMASELAVDQFNVSDDQLRDLISTLLDENPQLASRWARSRSLRERVPQEKSLPDPQLNYRYFVESPETRVGPQLHVLELSQGMPWTGKRKLQAERAESVAEGATWEAEDLESSGGWWRS